MDNLTPEQRHYCMSRIKAKDTSIETRVRSALHRRGYRFRKHAKNLPGTPDVVFTKAQVAVFIDGDFWHGYGFDAWSHKLSTPWHDKILTNIQRDATNHRTLRDMGWTVIRLWQHDINRTFDACISQIASAVDGTQPCPTTTHILPSAYLPNRRPHTSGNPLPHIW